VDYVAPQLFSDAYRLWKLSVLVWQHLIGLHLHWLVLPLTFIILVAVGSDYNLLLINRVKEEIHAGLHTGLIRALGSTGGVVTSAGLVFAFTMLAMLTSDLRTIGQVGTTVCIGLLLDTLIVRSFVVPCILRILGPGSGGQHWCIPVRYRSDKGRAYFLVKRPGPYVGCPATLASCRKRSWNPRLPARPSP
jgi:uncharacterized membrane protein YdfJ with MMPL/SSD domain